MDKEKDNNNNTPEDKPYRELSDNSGYFVYVSKKLEKLVSALYLLTQFFPKSDPLQRSIRQKGLALLELIHSGQERTGRGSYSRISQSIRSLVSELRVANNVGIVSDMNFQVLESEFTVLQKGLEDRRESAAEPTLDQEYFEVESLPESSSVAVKKDDQTKTKRNKSQDRSSSQVAATSKKESTSGADDDGAAKESPPSRKNGPKKRRRGIIMDILKDKPEVSVKDVTKVIPNYSAKTIQRDLKSLVKEGVLIKEGKRRWTTYRLAEQS